MLNKDRHPCLQVEITDIYLFIYLHVQQMVRGQYLNTLTSEENNTPS